EDHWVHADDRHEPEDHVEQDAAGEALEEYELSENYQLCDNFPYQEPRPGQKARWCTRDVGRPRDPGRGPSEGRHPEEILQEQQCERTPSSRDQVEDPIRIPFLAQVPMVKPMRGPVFLHRVDLPERNTPVADPV